MYLGGGGKLTKWSYELNAKVLSELSELQIKALLPTLTLGLSLVKVFRCCPVIGQETSKRHVK